MICFAIANTSQLAAHNAVRLKSGNSGKETVSVAINSSSLRLSKRGGSRIESRSGKGIASVAVSYSSLKLFKKGRVRIGSRLRTEIASVAVNCLSLKSCEKGLGIDRMVNSDGREIMITSGASGRVNALLSLRALKSLMALINAFVLFLFYPFGGRRRSSVSAVAVVGGEKGKEEKQECSGGASNRKGLPAVRKPSTILPWKSCVPDVGGSSRKISPALEQEVAIRRETAIERVTSDGGGDSVRDYFLCVTCRGDTMFAQSWTPVSIKIRGLVVLLHGLNEHSGRYDEFAKQLNGHGYKVYGMDWIGHGGSDGLHAYVHSLDDAVTDVKSFIMKVIADNAGLPCFCFGHSTGGAIILKAAVDPKIEACLAGVVLTSPAVGVQPSHPIFAMLAPVFSFLLPRYQFSAANKKGIAVSRDPEALVAKYSDPLVYTGSIRVRTGYEILRIASYLQQNLTKLRVPLLVLHGTSDSVTDPNVSQKLYEEASSADKTIRLLPGLLHDLLLEPEREEIVRDIIDWLNCRVEE